VAIKNKTIVTGTINQPIENIPFIESFPLLSAAVVVFLLPEGG
jgi:hypothetical protein